MGERAGVSAEEVPVERLGLLVMEEKGVGFGPEDRGHGRVRDALVEQVPLGEELVEPDEAGVKERMIGIQLGGTLHRLDHQQRFTCLHAPKGM